MRMQINRPLNLIKLFSTVFYDDFLSDTVFVLLQTPWSVVLGEVILAQVVKKFPAFYDVL
jgi:hypothetical protein